MIRPRSKPRQKSAPMPRKGFIQDGVIHYPDGREVCLQTVSGKQSYALRLDKMVVRQGWHCAGRCGGSLYYSETLDHQEGRGSGGGHRDDRIEIDGQWYNAALCGACNTWKGSRRFKWIDGPTGKEYVPVVRS